MLTFEVYLFMIICITLYFISSNTFRMLDLLIMFEYINITLLTMVFLLMKTSAFFIVMLLLMIESVVGITIMIYNNRNYNGNYSMSINLSLW